MLKLSTTLSRALQPAIESHPGLGGVYLLSEPRDAFAIRLQLIDIAEQTLDLQYYIWANDTTGRYLLDAVHRAAERGVRVRLLLDDYGCLGADELFSALNRHPQIDIRLFNPLISRRLKWTGYITNFSRLHRRMHNKAFTVDNQVTIVGGRNIGNIYFGGTGDSSFVDLDALAVGPVAAEVTADFDRYWESTASYPASEFLPAVDEERRQLLLTELGRHDDNDTSGYYRQALQDSPLLADILAGRAGLTWAPITMVSDDPSKVIEKCKKKATMSQQLALALGDPQHRVTLVSPYLIPMATGVELFRTLVAKGVTVSLLTNSLAASDVPLVHIAYTKYRKALVKAGVELFEMRPGDKIAAETDDKAATEPLVQKQASDNWHREKKLKVKSRLAGSKGAAERSGIMGSKSASLHAKTFAVDSQKLFVGSFNFDPRSIRLNTELGFIIESPDLAMQLEAYFDTMAAKTCYRLSLAKGGALCWREQADGHTLHYTCEPKTSFCKRLLNRCYALLPMDSFL